MGEITVTMADTSGGKDSKLIAKYVNDVQKLVKSLGGNLVSQVILGAISRTSGKLTIRPESERPKDSFNPKLTYSGSLAATFPVTDDGKLDLAHASPAGLSREGKDPDHNKWYAGHDDDDDTDVDERDDPAPASWGDSKGGGSSAIIYFTPHGKDETCARGSGMCGQQDDEILLHEMVHALRDMQGLTDPVPTTLRYKNEEEFLAIVVANVYISKKTNNNKLLRIDAKRYGPLEAPYNTSDGFLKNDENREILEYYVNHWQPVFDQLGKVDTVFNPFRKVKVKTPGKP